MTEPHWRGNPPRRVLVATTWYPDEAEPFRTPFCLAHVEAIRRTGSDVRVLHLDLRSTEAHERVEIYDDVLTTRIPLRAGSLRAWWRAFRIVRRELGQADVFHTMAFSTVLVTLAPWLSRPLPWVHTEHWNGVVAPEVGPRWWSRAAFLRHVLRIPNAVTAVTDHLRDAMVPFCRPGVVTTVPCVVAEQDVLPLPPQPPLRLVAVGLLNNRKDPVTAISTVAWLTNAGYDVHLTWVGEGPLREKAEEHARNLHIADRIHLVGAVVPDQVPVWLARAHLFFVPTQQENFFTAAAEAVAAGRIVVLPRSGGYVEYCNPQNSVLVDSRQPQDLGRAILSAAKVIEGVEAEQIAATLSERFSTAAVGSAFDRIYAQITRRTR